MLVLIFSYLLVREKRTTPIREKKKKNKCTHTHTDTHTVCRNFTVTLTEVFRKSSLICKIFLVFEKLLTKYFMIYNMNLILLKGKVCMCAGQEYTYYKETNKKLVGISGWLAYGWLFYIIFYFKKFSTMSKVYFKSREKNH